MKQIIIICLFVTSAIYAQEVADVSDPNAIVLITPDRGRIGSGTLRDTIANYPMLADKLRSESIKKLESDDEISAAKRVEVLTAQHVDVPKASLDKVAARMEALRKSKEAILNKAIKKAQDDVKTLSLDASMTDEQVAKTVAAMEQARALLRKAKTKKDELIRNGVPISKATSDAVDAAQPKSTPAPTPAPTPDDGLD